MKGCRLYSATWYDRGWDDGYRYLEVFGAFHRSVEVKVGNVGGHVPCVLCGDDTVEMALNSCDVNCWRANGTRIVVFMMGDSETYSILCGL